MSSETPTTPLFTDLGLPQPLLQALTMACLFRAFKQRDGKTAMTWYALGGLFLGLTAYTYLAARLFPVLALAAVMPILAARAGRVLTVADGALVPTSADGPEYSASASEW